MHYKWESVGDQGDCLRKVCYLGPYLLEHIEECWESRGKDKYGETIEVAMMVSNIYLWSDVEKVPVFLTKLPLVEYVHNESYKCLEDWYALNVLSEELFMGDADAPSRTSGNHKRNKSAKPATK